MFSGKIYILSLKSGESGQTLVGLKVIMNFDYEVGMMNYHE